MQFVGEPIARRHRLWLATVGVGLAVAASARAADRPTTKPATAGAAPTTEPAARPVVQPTALRPVVQLTAQPARDLLTDPSVVGGLLLRELQRQAVLIAARDELGLRTRDMVLREPFTVGGTDGATTVLCETQVRRAAAAGRPTTAALLLSHVDGGRQSPDSYPLADVPVDRATNRDLRRCRFDLPGGPLVDYPRFVAECERASRADYRDAVAAQGVLHGRPAEPTRWADAGSADAGAVDAGAVDPRTSDWMRQLDVYSQYNAARALHGQIRAGGASFERMSALVRAYANLGELTGTDWSAQCKVYTARSLLYAERLVAHENGSARSRYVRAYARAFANLTVAADDDLTAAGRDGACPVPAWAAAVAALARNDHAAAVRAAVLGPWSQRQVAALARKVVSDDDLPDGMTIDDVRAATTPYPGMTVTLTDAFAVREPRMRPMADGVVDRLPVLAFEALKDAPLPAAAAAAVRKLSPKPEQMFDRLAAVRDQLRAAATAGAADAAAEPSPAVLANLVEEEAFLAVVTRAEAAHSGNGQTYQVDESVKTAADPILRRHPWGPYVRALAAGYDANEQGGVKKDLAKVDPRDAGGWVRGAISAVWLNNDRAEAKLLEDRWLRPARLAADTIPVDNGEDADATAVVQAGRVTAGDVSRYDALMRAQDPGNAGVMCQWMRSVPVDRVLHEPGLYDRTLAEVRAKFADRVTVVRLTSDWAVVRGEYAQALSLLAAIDPSDPSPARCRQLGRLRWRLGRPDGAVADLLRGADEAGSGAGDGTDDRSGLSLEAAADLVDLGRPDAALDAVDGSADQATTPAWQLMARCHEAAGRVDDAETCLRMSAAGDPAVRSVDYYLWAKRHGRTNAAALGKAAAAAAPRPADNPLPSALILLADGDPKAAYKQLSRNADNIQFVRVEGNRIEGARPWLGYAELAVAAVATADGRAVDDAFKRAASRQFDDDGFSAAFAALAKADDPAAGAAAFDAWVAHQLDRHDRVDWLSLAGRLMVAAGHKAQGRRYLALAVQTTQYERDEYALAWLALAAGGDDPATLARRPATTRPTTAPTTAPATAPTTAPTTAP